MSHDSNGAFSQENEVSDQPTNIRIFFSCRAVRRYVYCIELVERARGRTRDVRTGRLRLVRSLRSRDRADLRQDRRRLARAAATCGYCPTPAARLGVHRTGTADAVIRP